MGFRLNRTYALRFEGALQGLEVDIRSTPIGVIRQFREADPERLAELLAEYTLRWNYEDADGAELPVTAESFMSLEEPVLGTIVSEWFKAAAGVTAPLEKPSTPGTSFQEATIPMEPQ